MSIPQDQLLLLARALSGKGNVGSGDINTLLSPELGYLTGTFYGGQDDEGDDELLWMDYAPNFRRALDLPDTDIRKIIAGEIYRGAAPWDVKRQIEEYTAGQAQMSPGLINQEGETKDLQSFANTVFTEYNNYQVAKTKAGRSAADKDPFVKAGIPDPSLDFPLQQLAPDLFEGLAKEAVARGAESSKLQQRGKSRASALKFLQEQQNAVRQADVQRADDYRARTEFVEPEGFVESFKRNMANTPMGRGEAGFTGLIPQLKYLEQIPASMLALKNAIVNPIADQALANIDYVGRNTIGQQLPKNLNFGDAVGAMLYGSKQNKSQPTNDGSFDRAENARFGRTAQQVVERSGGVEKDVTESAKKEKWLRDYTEALGVLVQAKARAAGYTPTQEALTQRANFLRAGGL